MLSRQQYRDFIKVDDLAFEVLTRSLPESTRETVRMHLQQDYMQDIGIIGLLRQTYLENLSLEDTARLFWSTRREPHSPRVETVLSQILINIAASAIFDVLKALAEEPEKIAAFLRRRDLEGIALGQFCADLPVYWEHAKTLFQLYRMKATGREQEVRCIIEEVLAGGSIAVTPDASAARDFDRIRSNVNAISRGLILRKLEDDGVFVFVPTDGVRLDCVGAAPGVGWGTPIAWQVAQQATFKGEFVLIAAKIGGPLPDAFLAILNAASAVVSSDGMVSHVAVQCRGIRKPCVLVSDEVLKLLANQPFLIVDGSRGIVGCYVSRPSDLPTADK